MMSAKWFLNSEYFVSYNLTFIHEIFTVKFLPK